MSAPASFDDRAALLIDGVVERVNEAWAPGAPFDSAAFSRLDDELSSALRSQMIDRVKGALAKFEGLAMRRLTTYKLNTPENAKHGKRKTPSQRSLGI